MLFIVKENHDISSLLEKIRMASASYKVVDIYGKRIVIAWPDNLVENIEDISIDAKIRVRKPYYLVSNEWKSGKTIVNVGGVEIGGSRIVVAAGPCAVEDEDILMEIAKAVKRAGASILRGGAYKPRTSPYSFQGLGEKGLKILKRVSEAVGLPVVTEVMDTRDVELVKSYADMIQIGARNSQNFTLLREVGRAKIPVLLKRGFGMTVEEWLLAAEYILSEGNGDVVLCERGIRTFEKSTRFTIDIGGMVIAKMQTHLPIAADPSHPAGNRDLVEPLALAAIVAGADMLIVEVHANPSKALSDSEQQLTVEMFEKLMKRLKAVAEAIGRSI
ncbi:3-deoxy-D-arabinoheptulosonate-7-phosphate synthase [Ignisphaera aggregans DSM 17230]|uniref:3-deoxy-D-arabinoheptulosonate-7-phosphate synthase n=1 Tax=Ignisphaera aggregans (strain DSM 17230 / JCM 13409 / AQ1.S1) TaxID=583356 RepID=E0SS72_IGNAA|nr:3-deoxy-D-arabinoheptulosonate-7-phosphate synthase [Ignisphaera aggregans DSM 17230]